MKVLPDPLAEGHKGRIVVPDDIPVIRYLRDILHRDLLVVEYNPLVLGPKTPGKLLHPA